MGDLINFEKPAKIITLFFDPNDPELRAEIESADQMVSYDINSMSMNELRDHARCSIVLLHREQIRHLKEIATIERKDPVLDAPARVGGLTFQKYIKWSTVVESAQRLYEHSKDEIKPIVSPADMLKIACGDLVLVPKEKIGALVDELHTAFQSNPDLTLGELLPLQQDFQAIIDVQEQYNNESF